MAETIHRGPHPTTHHEPQSGLPRPRLTAPARARQFRGRIGSEAAGGFYPEPHRYQVYLTAGCPLSLRVSITLDLLGLRDSVATTLTAPSSDPASTTGSTTAATTGSTTPPFPAPTSAPASAPGGPASLRSAYEATVHHYDGPLTVPALCDRWTGRVVSNHTPDILRDLADRFPAPAGTCPPRLRPPALAADIDAVRDLLDHDITQAGQRAGAAPASSRRGEALDTLFTALRLLDGQLAREPYVLGGEPTAADVDLWVTLVHLDAVHRLHLDAEAVHLIAGHDHLWAYVRRLHAHPAFHGNLRAVHMARLHRRTCRGPESSGAAVTLPGVLAAAV